MSQSSPSSQLAQSFASYLPPAVVRRIRANPESGNRPHLERFPAAVLFADISGFTELNERLTLTSEHAAEELTDLLNAYFSHIIGQLEAEGGEVVQFSGDALTAVFQVLEPAEPKMGTSGDHRGLAASVRRAWQAAVRMHRAKEEISGLPASLGQIALELRITVGAGLVSGLSVGGVNNRWQYVIAGDPMVQVATVAKQAEPGEIILSPEALALFSEQSLPPSATPHAPWKEVTEEIIRALQGHVPAIVSHRLLAGQAQWLSEMRNLSILFFGLRALDYTSLETLDSVQRWVRAFQTTIYRYEGVLNKLLVDDKGTVGMVLFGAPPRSHEDDPLRAVRCALDLLRLAGTQALKLAIGITSGQVFAGPVGSEHRREYTVIGDTVNLASRLMQRAAIGDIFCDLATYGSTQESVKWAALLPQSVKGKSAAVRIFRPLGLQENHQIRFLKAPLTGRDAELGQVNAIFDRVLAGRAQVLCLEGDAGIGKSALVSAIAQRTRDEGLIAFLGNGDALEQQTPYNAWRAVFRSYFDLQDLADPSGQRLRVSERLVEIAPQLRERVALLNDLLGLDLPETSLTTSFVPRLRQASLTSLLVELLARWAEDRPLVVILEDAQWLDSLSWRLAVQVVRSLPELPILLVLALRPLGELSPEHPYRLLQALSHCRHMVIKDLDADDTVRLVATELGVDELPLEIASFIAMRSTGNPLVAQEIARSLHNSGAIRIVNRQCMLVGHLGELQLPDTLQGLVLGRIDRLPANEQLTLKVAAVIGRTFGYATLRELLSSRIGEDALRAALDGLAQKQFIQPLETPTALRSHRFKQAIVQEIAYGTLLRSQRRELHEQTAAWYETYASGPDFYPLLAHHWRLAQRTEREMGYAVLAGHKLAADYANSEALSFLNRALQLTNDNQTQYELLRLRLEIHSRIGDRIAQEKDLHQLQALVNQPEDYERQAEVGNIWADYYRSIGDYDAARVALRYAQNASRQAHDDTSEAKNMTILGQVLEHQGAYKEAKEHFEHALNLCRKLGDYAGEAENLSRLSNIYRYLGDNLTARQFALEALDIRRNTGDRAKETLSLYNLGLIALELGEVESASAYRRQALEIAQAIGDRSSEALSLSAIGQGHLVEGDYASAQRYLQQALRLYEVMGERRSEANCLNFLGMVWRDVGNDRNAQRSFERALAIQEEIGSRSFAAYTYLNLGLVNLELNTAVTHLCYSNALERARETGNRDAEAYALSYTAGLHEHERRWDEATREYERALAIRKELRSAAASIEDTAGLARVASATGDDRLARQYADSCLQFMGDSGVEGMEFPLRVYLSCYDIFWASGDMKIADRVLSDAYQLLMVRANAISDPVMREGMLHNVSANQRVLEEYARHHPEAVPAYPG